MTTYGFLTKTELPSLLKLYGQLNTDDVPTGAAAAEKIWREIERQNIKYCVARQEGEIVSCCYIAIIPNLTHEGRSIGFIENVVTDKTQRRKGIGRQVLENAIAYAKEQNCYKVMLQSGNLRKEAHPFYESIGFDGRSKTAYEMKI